MVASRGQNFGWLKFLITSIFIKFLEWTGIHFVCLFNNWRVKIYTYTIYVHIKYIVHIQYIYVHISNMYMCVYVYTCTHIHIYKYTQTRRGEGRMDEMSEWMNEWLMAGSWETAPDGLWSVLLPPLKSTILLIVCWAKPTHSSDKNLLLKKMFSP